MRTQWATTSAAVVLAALSLAFSAPACAQTSTVPPTTVPPTTAPPASVPPAAVVAIKWEVKSRFRLFKNEDNFEYLARFYTAGTAGGVLASENALAADTKGSGWARKVVTGLCIDDQGQLQDICTREYSGRDEADRDTIRDSYLAPSVHRIGAKADGAPTGALCTWKFVTEGNNTAAAVKKDKPCTDEVYYRAPYGRTTQVQLFVASHPEDGPPTATADVKVRDILIAGLGDSTAAGEGNPDRPIGLADDGFCFRRFDAADSNSYFRPNRYGYNGDSSCTINHDNDTADALAWAKERAHWMDGACHRSLYSYQVRVALALAIENPQIAVTYIPLGCTGATIAKGMLDRQDARERDCDLGTGRTPCSRFVNGQVDALRQLVEKARQRNKNRSLDLLLLTIGANDIDFSGLVANVIIDHATHEYYIFREHGFVADVSDAKQKLTGVLVPDFARLRAALKPLVGNKLERVIFVSYGHPGLHNNGQVCPASRQGFDVHPAFKIDGDLLKSTANFVTADFFPRLKALATCESGGGCLAADAMTFVDAHQAQFRDHGFCAQAGSDPLFDRDCFLASGQSFRTDSNKAPLDPLACAKPASSFRAYSPRQRWIRTANDSYFAAMTYPDGEAEFLQPSDIHDAIWGVASAVYGGAMHPTAQGYAAMADATLPPARRLLGLPAPQ